MDEPTFQALQHAFTAHIRNPKAAPKPSQLEDRRMAIYRELFFNNILGFVSSAFPVLASLYSEKQWQARVRQFFSQSSLDSPYFVNIAEGFLNFLVNDYETDKNDPPFIHELAHYEWLELALSLTEPDHTLTSIKELEHDALFVSPLVKVVSYQYPVCEISSTYQPQAPLESPLFLILYADDDADVTFISTTQLMAVLLNQMIASPGLTLKQYVQEIHALVPDFSFDVLYDGALTTFSDFQQRKIIQTKNGSATFK